MSEPRHVYHRAPGGAETASIAELAKLVPQGSLVLELGPGTGTLTRLLASELGCTVDAVELDPTMAAAARPACRTMIEGDLDSLDLPTAFGSNRYDVVVLADVLEHLAHPQRVLASLAPLLAPEGRLLLSVPNVAYAGLVADLAAGRFEYRDEGLLDRTHRSFYTRASLDQLLRGAGFHPWRWTPIVRPLGESEFASRLELLPPALVEALTARDDALCYQWIVDARMSAPQHAPQPPPSSHDLFPVRVFWAGEGEDFDYARSVVEWATVGNERQKVALALPRRSARLRLRLADRPGFLRIYGVTLATAEGRPTWHWRPSDGAASLESSRFNVSLDCDGDVAIARIGDAESSLDLAIPPSLLAEGEALTVELAWPMSADYRAATRHLRRDDERQREVDHLKSLVAERDAEIASLSAQLAVALREHAESSARLAEQNDALAKLVAQRDESNEHVDGIKRHLSIARQNTVSLEADLSRVRAEVQRLNEAAVERERVVRYRQSVRWWCKLPFVRLRAAMRGER